MNNRIALLLILSCILFVSGCGNKKISQTIATDAAAFPDYSSEDAGDHFDAEKIQALEARMRKFVNDGDVHGIATLLVKNGEVISHTQAGVRRLVDSAPITEDTIYRIYSMTKPITGVAMMTLYEQGKFKLDDPITKFIPEFANLKVVKSYDEEGNVELEDLQRQPTMRELMSHTAGFAYGLYGSDPSNIAFIKQGILGSPDLGTFIAKVATVPLITQPGKQWFYSAAVDIQGAIIERISGMTFGEYLQQKIFTPLRMEDTGFYVPAEDYDRFSDVFAYHPETKKFQRLPFDETKYNRLGDVSFKREVPRMESGGGGLVSTLSDYARFCQMLIDQGEFEGQRILRPETINLMRTDVLVDDQAVNISGTLSAAQSAAIGFGLNVGTIRNSGDGGILLGDGSYFWGGAAGTWFWIDPKNDLYFIGMMQRVPQGGPEVDFRGESQKLVYGALR